MSTIMPQGELLRRAVKWIDEKRAETGESFSALVDKAAMNFNLSPKDADFLTGFFKERESAPKG
ncbi:MAG: hypothetical protein AAGU21_00460 [Solidesulfovibrio sp.]|jgi:hypothetical protein|uniref:hypothetical protein n=1 Tax=Solidesulfovibrio sp. TaxID=2910990 RepID=UPI00315838AD